MTYKAETMALIIKASRKRVFTDRLMGIARAIQLEQAVSYRVAERKAMLILEGLKK